MYLRLLQIYENAQQNQLLYVYLSTHYTTLTMQWQITKIKKSYE